ncbi:hypothetical protein [uncultured Pseudosulfitobacter sp.]|uniref:hypothetical protein n=1 Tax=uncultured Pseudosulfitobacter sp. TaxID=2854214 RepID=UPI0030DCBFC2|tara:strand:- start:3726 stop:5888 length:2163 start_codon:yes stop_codon:yes gene_type:complete
MDEERLIVALEARIRDFEKNMQRAEQRGTRSYQSLQRGSRGATAAMERDMVRSTTRINQALATTSSKIGLVGKAFVAGAIASGMAAITSGAGAAVRSLAELDRQAKRSGLSVTAFQKLKFVAEQNRIDVDAMIDGIKEMQLRTDEFAETGGGSAADALKRLGYRARELGKKLEDPSELFLDMIDRMEDLDRAAQIRVADEVFGGTGGERFVELLSQGDDGIRKIMSRADELGIVMDEEAIAKAAELDRKFAEITARVSTLSKTIVVNLAGAIEEALTVDVDEIFGSAERAISMMGEANYRAMKGASDVTGDQREDVEDLVETYEELFRAINAATGPDGIRLMDVADIDAAHELAAILQDIDREMQAFTNGETKAADFEGQVFDLVAEAENLTSELSDVDAQRFGNVVDAIGGIASALAKAAQNAAALRASLPEGDTETSVTYGPQNGRPRRIIPISELAPSTSPRPHTPGVDASFGFPDPVKPGGGGGGTSDVDDYQSRVEQTREEIAMLEAEAVALTAVAMSGREYADVMEYARKKAELLYDAQKAGKEITPELEAEIDQLAQAYATAGAAAEEAADRIDAIKENAERGADRMSDMFMSIVDGSMSAKDALAALLIEIAKVQMQKAFLGLAESGGGGSFLQTVGSWLGFSGGGYTGAGGKHDPAGVVHKGEYVVQASQVAKPGMRGFLDALNSGLPGFARGGLVPGCEGGNEIIIGRPE